MLREALERIAEMPYGSEWTDDCDRYGDPKMIAKCRARGRHYLPVCA